MEPRTFTPRTLRHGPLRFGAVEVGQGPVVLCLHGFPDHRRTWRHLLPELAAAGFRAVAPDLRGYEPSSVPADGDYHLATLARDVVAWLDDLGVDRCHLVGHDWGAAIGSVVASLAPERLRSLTMVAVPPLRRVGRIVRATPEALGNLWYMAFFQLPAVPERALLAGDGALVRRLWRDWSPGWRAPEEEMRWVVDVLRQPGVARAALGYYRALPDAISRRGRESWRLLTSRIPVPTLLVTGERDGCMDARAFTHGVDLRDFPAGVRVERFPDAGHFLHLEQPERFRDVLLPHLR